MRDVASPEGSTAPALDGSRPAEPAVPEQRVHEPLRLLMRDLRTGPQGLSDREANRRLIADGPNELQRRGGKSWPGELLAQVKHPLALLLWAAAALALVAHTVVLALAIVAVLVLNAAFAFLQEQQAEQAVEALTAYLPARATVVRAGHRRSVLARELVPGDVLVLSEGDAVSADARLLEGTVEVDMSMLTGESVPVARWAAAPDTGRDLMEAEDLVFSGTTCVTGAAKALVYRTGMATQLGRIAALTERVDRTESPLERQVRRVAWLIAGVATVTALAFLPLGILAGLPPVDAFVFAVGLLVANVPEGLLPTITLALAVGVRQMAKRGALVKRLSAVETLGSTDVICTDKTGTLTVNRMSVVTLLGPDLTDELLHGGAPDALVQTLARCTSAELGEGRAAGDPTELALLRVAADLGADVSLDERARNRRHLFPFDPALRLMTTVDAAAGGTCVVHTKGAPEAVLDRCSTAGGEPLTPERIAEIRERLGHLADQGLRLLALAGRTVLPEVEPADREAAETGLDLLGVAGMVDPPRQGIGDAVARCHSSGIRVIMITGDNGRTAAAVAREVGMAGRDPVVVEGRQLAAMTDAELEHLLRRSQELVFARSAPDAKLRIADALRGEGHVVAMTGDGVNDAPALRRSDIGVAMGASGTDVAREAATMILTDDDFATITYAVEAGRRVYDNVRKFILYIFAHAVPEIVPFLLFALSGGRIPLPLTVLLVLAIDLGTETLPALALGREPAEPGLMRRPPRSRTSSVIDRRLLLRAWLLLGTVSAALSMAGFFLVLGRAGWSPGDATAAGSPLRDAYLTATTMTFAGIVSCQVGVAFAARTERASLRSIGLRTNPLLLWGIAFELAFAAAVIYAPPLQAVFGTRPLGVFELAVLAPFPVVVWGVDELARAVERGRSRRGSTRQATPRAAPAGR